MKYVIAAILVGVFAQGAFADSESESSSQPKEIKGKTMVAAYEEQVQALDRQSDELAGQLLNRKSGGMESRAGGGLQVALISKFKR